jgi:hypothetical protein
MGKTVRFARQQSIVSYKSNLPVAYVDDGAKVLKSPPQMGTIGNEKRWKESDKSLITPGVGSYNIAGFKSIAKASESTFDLGSFRALRQNQTITTDEDLKSPRLGTNTTQISPRAPLNQT